MGKKSVIYNGVKVVEDWPAKIQAAQSLTHYTISGCKFPRIRFGDEGKKGWGQKPCLDCAVLKGQFHVPDCEYEKCPSCREDFAGGCFCDIDELQQPDDERDQQSSLKAQKRIRTFNRWCWAFVIIAILLLGRSILMLFGI